MWGPYNTDVEVHADLADVYAAFDRDPRPGVMRVLLQQRLTDVLDAAGVERGARDEQTLAGLAWRGSAETVQVICGWISRANVNASKHTENTEPGAP